MNAKQVVPLGCLLLALGAGCGDSTDEPDAATGTAGQALAEPRACLVAAGATLADAADDMTFARADIHGGRIEKPAGAGTSGVEVSQYSPVDVDAPEGPDRVPAYVLWVGSPASEAEPDILALAADNRPDTFVAYSRRPSHETMTEASKCLDRFGAG